MPLPINADAAGDAALLRRVAARDSSALKRLHEGHFRRLMAVAVSLLKDLGAAEDLVQEVFLEVWSRAADYDPRRGSPAAWLVIMTRSRALDLLRRRAVGERTLFAVRAEPAAEGARPPLEIAERRQAWERASAAIADLPQEQRAALQLAYFEGLTQSEIAQRMNSPLGTVKTRVRQALQALAAQLSDEGARGSS